MRGECPDWAVGLTHRASLDCQQQLIRVRALTAFRDAVQDGSFPDDAHSIAMPPDELEKFREELDRTQTGAGSAARARSADA